MSLPLLPLLPLLVWFIFFCIFLWLFVRFIYKSEKEREVREKEITERQKRFQKEFNTTKLNVESKNTASFPNNNPIIVNYNSLSYEELLRTPEWYQKRIEIFAKKGYKCEWCNSVNNLQLHHKYYAKYPNNQRVYPWEYPDKAFMVLCHNCHKKYHEKYMVKTYYVNYGSDRTNLQPFI